MQMWGEEHASQGEQWVKGSQLEDSVRGTWLEWGNEGKSKRREESRGNARPWGTCMPVDLHVIF